ncbi:MAG: hypothetical protein ACRDN6_15430 [Gaiellaceae bacterium]
MTRLRRYDDPRAGISEEFTERRLGPGRAFALLSAPLGERRTPGWVICPSVGPEHGNLRRLEAIVARRLAAAGFPVLRIRPDVHPVHGAIGEIALPARLAEVDDAVELLLGEGGAQAVGLLGTMFGGTVAALACERLGLQAMALIEPVGRGKQYLRESLRREAVAELMAGLEAPDSSPEQNPMQELQTTGRTTIRGLRLSRAEFERISAVNLAEDLRSFRGRSLLVGISPTGGVSPGLRKLQERLEALGGDVTVEVIDDPLEAPFGEYYYRNVGIVRIDTRLGLDQRLADAAATWALDEASARTPAEVV